METEIGTDMEQEKEKMLYSVSIVETLRKVVTVAASDVLEAHQSVRARWDAGDVVLTAEDFEEVEIHVNGMAGCGETGSSGEESYV